MLYLGEDVEFKGAIADVVRKMHEVQDKEEFKLNVAPWLCLDLHFADQYLVKIGRAHV